MSAPTPKLDTAKADTKTAAPTSGGASPALGAAPATAATTSVPSTPASAGGTPTAHPVKVENKAQSPQTVVVFGGGTFGTALATVLARNGHKVTILLRGENEADSINNNHKNLKYLTEYTLHDQIRAATDAKTAMAGVTLIVHAVPVQQSLDFLQKMAPLIPADVPIVSLSKGIHSETLEFMCDIITRALARKQPACFFSGPSFARELMDRQPTGVVVAAETEQLANRVGGYFQSDRVRVYTSTDVIGVEVGGALKNIYAIAAGSAQGLGFGLNTAAFLVTRGCSEMKKLALARGAKESTLAGLSGIGDLMLTCFGPASRNRTVGVRLGKGEKLDDILASMGEVAEGVPTAAAAIKMAKQYNVEVPIASAVADILAGRAALMERVASLLSLPLRPEDA